MQRTYNYTRSKTTELWHRTLGAGFPCLNIDSVEFLGTSPKALIEYKRFAVELWSKTDYQATALRNLADMAGLPCFLVEYNGELGSANGLTFTIHPLNGLALLILEGYNICEAKPMGELQYTEFLKAIRTVSL